MHPILFSLGSVVISSFGFFLSLAFISAVFVSWKLARIYDINEEKILDLAILTFFGGLIGARIFFIATHLELFDNFSSTILVNRYHGLSFWGGLLGGILTLYLLVRRTKLNFWQIADFAAVSLLLGISLGDVGCFLGGCAYGITTNFPLAFSVVGLLEKRAPVSAVESFFAFFIFFYLFRAVKRFHFAGKITALTFIILAILKFTTEFWRGDNQFIPGLPAVSIGHLLSGLMLVSGILIFYYQSKRSFLFDLKMLTEILYSSKRRQVVLASMQKTWYNFQIGRKVKIQKTLKVLTGLPKILKRRFNVKSTPKHIIEN